jgi:hypothetical protein
MLARRANSATRHCRRFWRYLKMQHDLKGKGARHHFAANAGYRPGGNDRAQAGDDSGLENLEADHK